MDVMELYASGYRVGRPNWGLIDGASIDADVCTKSTCGECSHIGMEYHPFVNDTAHSYRAFAKCPACGHSEEF